MTIRVALFALFLFASTATSAGTLVVNLNSAEPAPRAAWDAVVQRFERENPSIRVELNLYDHESYKRAIRNWLTGSPPDVVFWFAGNRMRQFVAPGLLEDVSEIFTADVSSTMHKSALELVSVDGRQYGVPYTYYQVGLYFRRDVLANAGLRDPPSTWTELIAACDALKRQGIEPFAIGTKDLWPAAAWFDYLDLRLNGLAFHRSLMDGGIPYTDPRVRHVFGRWRELVDRGCFSRYHASSTWQESQALLYQGKAGMMLIGNYIVANFPADIRDQMDFARFPALRADIGRYEDAPMNTIHVPRRARNKEDAKRFLAFVMRADVQQALNTALVQIPVNLRAATSGDRFLDKGRELLGQADGLAQYFDRDTNEDVASVAMKGFQEFMLHPARLDAILDTIERARIRAYGASAGTSR